ncbi:MAG: hypothetical protein KY455_01050 [Euryarchaeota archaeon]|nr:hypothetical protein [Euryarchaeota archaeon]
MVTGRTLFIGLVVFVVALSGCTDDAGPQDRGGGTNETESPGPLVGPIDDAVQPVTDLTGLDPGVTTVPATGSGGVDGIVFDAASGRPVAEAQVFLVCAAAATVADLGTRVALEVDGDGRFALPAAPPFTACPEWTYHIEAAGYTLLVPIGHGPVVESTWYLVHVGLTPDAA